MVRRRHILVGYNQSSEPVSPEKGGLSHSTGAAPYPGFDTVNRNEVPDWILNIPDGDENAERPSTPVEGEELSGPHNNPAYEDPLQLLNDLPPECSFKDSLWIRLWTFGMFSCIVFCLWLLPSTRPMVYYCGHWTFWAYGSLNKKRIAWNISGWVVLIAAGVIWAGLEIFFWGNWIHTHKIAALKRHALRFKRKPKDPFLEYSKRDSRLFKNSLEADPSLAGVIIGIIICVIFLIWLADLTAPLLSAGQNAKAIILQKRDVA